MLPGKGTINLDALPENADWAKKSWDLGRPLAVKKVLKNHIDLNPNNTTQENLDRFMKTPTGRGMPQKHREVLRHMGYTVEDYK